MTPAPGSENERQQFAALQQRLPQLFTRVFRDRHAPQTIVVIPSMSLDHEELRKLEGAGHYEERLLCLLMLLRFPRANMVYVTSEPLSSTIVDYYLHLLPGVPPSHVLPRLALLSCNDGSSLPLTEKILARRELIDHIRGHIADPMSAHMTCFNVTAQERTLAVQLGIPLYGCDPDFAQIGTKSGSRETFRRAGVPLPYGHERLRDANDIVHALADVKRADPTLRRAMVKLDDGFSGEGNAIFSFEGVPDATVGASTADPLVRWVRKVIPTQLKCVAEVESWETFSHRFATMQGIVESFVSGDIIRSPSVQCRIDPLHHATVIATHDQILGGSSGQVYQGCTFPANPAYSADLHEYGARVARLLAQDGVLSRFAVDFMTVQRDGAWHTTAIEINLRKGGTTHPFLMLQFLTDGEYDVASGVFYSLNGNPCYYHATDNLRHPSYVGLTPERLIDIAVSHDLHFDAASQEGVMFHLMGTLAEHGKVGTLCVGRTPENAGQLYQQTVAALTGALE
ncbi:peptide ligase PGM1-related protein [Gemmatimonas phototrophica]|uniref:Carboxylate-amine ligase n=1 Tax=Gemmatimonas phototrophica TaxID=1379270 RepID=A0A143BH81_9BACT|nr:peptide ligase PGM1-related protein [Gemmatimonas phototrophica]AMW03764.1 carboxylate-amine ligase [Gemmatimonas phototrophica]